MALTIPPGSLDQFDLVLVVDPDGLVQWSAHRSRSAVVAMLRGVADDIEEGKL